jgi:hypothetical protein
MSIISIPYHTQTALTADMSNNKTFHFTVISSVVSAMLKKVLFSTLISPLSDNNTRARAGEQYHV